MPRKIKVGDFVSRCESKTRLNDSNDRDVGIVTLLCSNEQQVEVKWNSDAVVVKETKKELKIISDLISGKERMKVSRAKKDNGVAKIRKPMRLTAGVAKIRKSIAAANLVGVSAVIPVTIAATPQDAINRDAQAFEVKACNFIL